MTAHIIDGRAIAQALCTQVAASVSQLSITPCLAVVYVGEDPATAVYVGRKRDTAQALGIESRVAHFPGDVAFSELMEKIIALNEDPAVHGILLQLPLPISLDRFSLLEAIVPHKDVDGLTSRNLGLLAAGRPRFLPCTPQGCLRIFDHVGYDLAGKNALMIGRSSIVGLPLSLLLGQRDATVTVAHSRTQDLQALIREADVVISAVGQPGLVTAVKTGAFVIDVGINRLQEGASVRLVGDVDMEAVSGTAGYLTPVPGGVGPMTVACLMHNTLRACEGG
jgi:methylenetetrahydrofolate dehydrogenase (NADP+)/methenyltetrahydrofolate cyclohydrolase